jgi:hypothetical protein
MAYGLLEGHKSVNLQHEILIVVIIWAAGEEELGR